MREGDACREYGITPATYSAVQRSAKRSGVPAPWDDPQELGRWYQEHYVSNSSPSRARAQSLPEWIKKAIRAESDPPPSAAPLEHDRVTAAGPGEDTAEERSNSLEEARRMMDDALARYQRGKGTPAESLLHTEFLKLLERFQLAQARSRRAGDEQERIRGIVTSIIEPIHRKLPSHIEAELVLLHGDAGRAAESPEKWLEFCGRFREAVGHRLAQAQFQIPDNEA